MANCEEILVKVPPEDYLKLQEVLKTDWPRCISGYYILGIQKDWLDKGFDYDVRIYCPRGDARNGMVAVHDKGPFYEIFIDCPNEDTSILENALRTTNKIHWKQEICIMFSPSHVTECVKRIADAVGVSFNANSFVMDVLDKDAPLYDISIPPGLLFKPLTGIPQEIELINSKWPHKYTGSENYFKVLIQQGFGYGLYKNEELVSWVFIKENGALGHIFTLKEHRRKGYGALVKKSVSNRLLAERKDVFDYVLQSNEEMLKLNEKLGFKMYRDLSCCGLTPK